VTFLEWSRLALFPGYVMLNLSNHTVGCTPLRQFSGVYSSQERSVSLFQMAWEQGYSIPTYLESTYLVNLYRSTIVSY